jgi:tetratricopeptide (TPR) repeat protein
MIKHLKYTLVVLTQVCLCFISFTQQKKVDSLNDLGLHYASSINKPDWDTAVIYINQAYKEAVRLNYTKGIACAIFNQGYMEQYSHNYPAAERHFRDCIPYFKKVSDMTGQGFTHFNIGYTLYVQGFFDEALAEFQTSIPFFQHDKGCGEAIVKALEFLGVIYGLKGELVKGFELAQKGLKESKKRNDSLGMAFPLMIIGDLYRSMEDYPMALEYYQASAALGGHSDTYLSAQMAVTYSAMDHYDSALYYYQKAYVKDPGQMYFQVVLGEIYLQQKKYKEALETLQKTVPVLEKNNGRKELLRVLLDIAEVYAGQKNYPAALQYTQQGVGLTQQTGARQYMARGLKMLSTIYEAMGVNERALIYLTQYIHLKDSLLNDQLKAKLFAYKLTVENEKKQTQIERLSQEKLVGQQQLQIQQQKLKIQQQQLQRSSMLKKILIGGSLTLVLLGMIVFRNLILKRRNEKLQSERTQAALQHKTAELEMQALRAQMNPHFIFNSLNSINQFILENDKAQASEYLTKFSRLVRLILQNSQADLILLESELEALQLYLELEALRFNHHFDFIIKVDDDVDVSILKVPPLIIQPYAENAIWHGLMHKKEKGFLEIDLSQKEDVLYCRTIDDGIGRQKAAELKNKFTSTHRSMGMRITADRIELLQHQKLMDTSVQITDLVLPDGRAGGTEVVLKIPVLYN